MRRDLKQRGARAAWLAIAGIGFAWATSASAHIYSDQLPGDGSVVTGHASYMNSGPPAGFHNAATLTVSGNTVIDWGSGHLNVGGSHGGFTIGQDAYLLINHSGAASLLNVDTSGNASYILGEIQTVGAHFPVYVANGNGIVVGSEGAIVAGGGFGLLAYSYADQNLKTFSGTVSVSNHQAADGEQITVAPGATFLTHVGSALLLAGEKVTVGFGQQVTGTGTQATNPVNFLSGYSFAGFNASNGTYATAPQPVQLGILGGLFPPGQIVLNGTSTGWVAPKGSLVYSYRDITTSGNLTLPGSSGLRWGHDFINEKGGTLSFLAAVNNSSASPANNFLNYGTVESYGKGNVALSVGGYILNDNGTIESTGAGSTLTLAAVRSLTNHEGTISGAGNTVLSSSDSSIVNFNNDAKPATAEIVSGGTLALSAAHHIRNQGGTIEGAGNTTLTAGSFIHNEGNSGNAGVIGSTAGYTSLHAGRSVRNQGEIFTDSGSAAIYLYSGNRNINNHGGTIGLTSLPQLPIYANNPIKGGTVHGAVQPTYQAP